MKSLTLSLRFPSFKERFSGKLHNLTYLHAALRYKDIFFSLSHSEEIEKKYVQFPHDHIVPLNTIKNRIVAIT